MSERILVLEDDESLRLVMTRALARAGFEVRATASLDGAQTRLHREGCDLLIADVVLGQDNFLDHLEVLLTNHPGLPVIVVSAQTTAQTAIHSSLKGATRYLPKPFDLDDLVEAAKSALKSSSRQSPRKQSRQSDDPFAGLIGQSASMQPVFKAMGRLATLPGHVLISGPVGAGKAKIARALHEARGGDSLLEAGPAHLKEKGSDVFSSDHDGYLLRRLERWDAMTCERILEHIELNTDVPVYVTTSSLGETKIHGDLAQRLGRHHIILPSLSERHEDIELMFETLYQERFGVRPDLKPDGLKCLTSWSWPGEISEMHRLVHRLYQDDVTGPITAGTLQAILSEISQNISSSPESSFEILATNAILSKQDDVAQKLHDELDRALIDAALKASGGIRLEAAKKLGWNRNTFARRMKMLNLSGQDED